MTNSSNDNKPKHSVMFAAQDRIYAAMDSVELNALFEHVLGMHMRQCFLSDESSLSDFSGSGMPDELRPVAGTLEENSWDAWVTRRIREDFGVELTTTAVTLVDLVPMLRAGSGPVATH